MQGHLALPFEPAEGGGVHEFSDIVVALEDVPFRFAQRGARPAETGDGVVDEGRYLLVTRDLDPFR